MNITSFDAIRHAARDRESPISPIEDILEDARNGRPYILADAEDRENEGDVIIPAQFATPEQVNFMARHARGLICLAITADRARHLRLPPMAAENQESMKTAFTVSIEAAHGVTTASARPTGPTPSRWRSIPPRAGRHRHARPCLPAGRQGRGVLVRAGHTEAAVDISRLAGLNPAGVICEIMKDDGTMARMPDLVAFAQLHGLKIGTIADLIAYRRRTERQVERVLERPFDSIYGGHFKLLIYRNIIDRTEHAVLLKGRIDSERPTLVRVHQVDMAADMLGHVEARRDYIPAALKALGEHEGPGVAVFIRDPNPAWLSERYGQDVEREQARQRLLRDYGVGAQILKDLGVRDMVLLTSSQAKLAGLEGYGLRVVGRQPFSGAGA
jgi:3,4-dihydroxy 2-butanone 4-phosphate synthase/GTP cyclohydrolase II